MRREAREPRRHSWVFPSALMLRPDRIREMMEGHGRLEPSFEHRVTHAFVVVDRGGVEAVPLRFDTAPFDRNPERAVPERGREAVILIEAMIVVAGDTRDRAVADVTARGGAQAL